MKLKLDLKVLAMKENKIQINLTDDIEGNK